MRCFGLVSGAKGSGMITLIAWLHVWMREKKIDVASRAQASNDAIEAAMTAGRFLLLQQRDEKLRHDDRVHLALLGLPGSATERALLRLSLCNWFLNNEIGTLLRQQARTFQGIEYAADIFEMSGQRLRTRFPSVNPPRNGDPS